MNEKEIRKLIKENGVESIDWEGISRNQTLSEDFIREFKDKVNWDYISAFQSLSEEFIEKMKDKVNW